MKLFRTILGTLVCVLFAACQGDKAPELRGHIPAEWCGEDLLLTFSITGDPLDNTCVPLAADSTGLFTFSMDSLGVDELDVTIGADEWIYGAHLQKGKVLDVYLSREQAGEEYSVDFKGDNADMSRFFTVFVQAYDVMKYFSPDPSEAKTTAEYRQILEDEHQKAVAALDLLPADRRDYYSRLTEGMYTWSKIRILMDQAYEEGKKEEDYEEYRQLSKGIDPNDPINLRTNMTSVWLSVSHKQYGDEDGSPYYIESLQIIDEQVTNPDVRAALVHYVPYVFFHYTDGNVDKTAFWEYYKEFAKDYPQYIAEFEPLATAKSVENGTAMPYDPVLTRPDGTACRLSDLRGTLVYIDFWATWCGPCCKEIPHLERRVEQFKGKEGVRFISISMDSDHDAWQAKLKADKPTWDQFILSDEENQAVSSALQITGIPRFVLLDAEGNIIDHSAPRPSDDAMVELIESHL